MYGSLSTSRRPTYNPLPASKLLLLSDGPGETAAPPPPGFTRGSREGKKKRENHRGPERTAQYSARETVAWGTKDIEGALHKFRLHAHCWREENRTGNAECGVFPKQSTGFLPQKYSYDRRISHPTHPATLFWWKPTQIPTPWYFWREVFHFQGIAEGVVLNF